MDKSVPNTIQNKGNRILALDILRGITIAGMILVNNPGSWTYVYAPLQHAEWNGLTPTDLVFPFFIFIMGISMFISLRKYNFEASGSAIRKILKRTILLYLVGMGIAWFSLLLSTWNALNTENLPFLERLWKSAWNFDRIRILGVIPRLAICYGVGSIISLVLKHKYIPHLIAVLLIGYFILLLLGNGFEYNRTNILSIIDFKILGEAHIRNDNGIEVLGILSTIPAIANVLLGFYVGKIMFERKDIHSKIEWLFIIGAVLTFAGFLFSYACPINKKIWSPSYVLVSGGLAASLLALLIWIIDVKGKKKWSQPLEVFGVNPLFMYVLAEIIAVIIGNILINSVNGKISLKALIYKDFLQPIFGNFPGSLVFAVFYVAFIWGFGYYLYKKKIYIKL